MPKITIAKENGIMQKFTEADLQQLLVYICYDILQYIILSYVESKVEELLTNELKTKNIDLIEEYDLFLHL